VEHLNVDKVELYLSGLTGMASHPDMRKIRIIGFISLEIGCNGRSKFCCYYLQYVLLSKLVMECHSMGDLHGGICQKQRAQHTKTGLLITRGKA